MKTLTALFAAATLTLTAGLAQANENDVLLHHIPQLLKEGKIKPLEELNEVALKLHPGSRITKTQLEHRLDGYIYEVDLIDANKDEKNVDLLAATGKVLNNK
ncbi:PepSY domain-containing protein [Pseudomonas sp. LB3P81]